MSHEHVGFNLLPEDFQSGKMDQFAGSEPRKFISFRLESGQPTSGTPEAKNDKANKLVSAAYSSSSTSSLSETSGLSVLTPLTMSRESAVIHSTETPLDATPANQVMEETTRTEQVGELVIHESTGATLLGVAQYASSSSSEGSCGSYFNRQNALIEKTRPPGPPDETAEVTKESLSEPMIVSRVPHPSPPLAEDGKEAPMEEETIDPANKTAIVLSPNPPTSTI